MLVLITVDRLNSRKKLSVSKSNTSFAKNNFFFALCMANYFPERSESDSLTHGPLSWIAFELVSANWFFKHCLEENMFFPSYLVDNSGLISRKPCKNGNKCLILARALTEWIAGTVVKEPL